MAKFLRHMRTLAPNVSVCGRTNPGYVVDEWSDVTCKNCLKSKPLGAHVLAALEEFNKRQTKYYPFVDVGGVTPVLLKACKLVKRRLENHPEALPPDLYSCLKVLNAAIEKAEPAPVRLVTARQTKKQKSKANGKKKK